MTMSSSSCLAAHSAVVLDMTRQSSLRAPRYRSLSLVLPRALLAPLVADLDALHGRILQRSTALNAMLARHLGALYDEAPPPRRRQHQPRRRQRVYEHAAAVARDGAGRW